MEILWKDKLGEITVFFAVRVRASETLTWNFPITIGDMVKDHFGFFLFLKGRKYLSSIARKLSKMSIFL